MEGTSPNVKGSVSIEGRPRENASNYELPGRVPPLRHVQRIRDFAGRSARDYRDLLSVPMETTTTMPSAGI